MNLVELLRAFGADEALIALAERWTARQVAEDGTVTYPDGVEALTDDELGVVLAGLIALGEDDEAGIALLEAAADTAVDLRTEQAARVDAAEAEEAEAEAARARLRGDDPVDENADPNAPAVDPAVDPEADPEVDPNADPAADPNADPAAVPEPEAVTAAGRADLRSLARRVPARARPPVVDDAPAATLMFAADVPGVPSGQTVTADRANLTRVSEAMQRRFESFRRSVNSGAEEIPIATLRAVYPDDRRLVDGDGEALASAQMSRVVARVMEMVATPQAITAAGGLCGPLMPYYGVEVLGDARRPVRDEALVGFQATRGGIISMTPPILPQVAGSIGIWTMDDDVTAGSDETHTKVVIEVECGSTVTTRIRAITARLKYGNIISRTFGEWTQAWADLQLVAQARVAEGRLLADIKTGSKVVDLETTDVSAVRDTLNVINRAAWGMRSRHRTLRDFPFRVILPEVWLAIAAEDLASGLPGGNGYDEVLSLAVARIMGWFASRNLNVTFSPDMSVIGPQAATTELAELPPTVEFAVYPEGTWLHLDNGEIDLGVVRDIKSNSLNNYETFSETFEAAHKLGVESIWGSLNVCPSGAVRGTIDPTGRCASYT